MELIDPELSIKLLSVIELHLPAQNCIITPRAHCTLSFRAKGKAFIAHGDKHYSVNDGDILFIPAGCSYRIRSEKEVLLCINLAIAQYDKMLPEHFVPLNVPVFQEAFQSIYDTWCMKKPGYYHKCMSILYSILSQLDKQFSQAYLTPAFRSIKHAINYMHANFTDPGLSITALCNIAKLSDTQFRRNFFEVYGTTPLKYLQTLRVNYAADLLANSSLSIEEISSISGFSDSKYFCAVFKKHKFRPPSEFRKSL